MCGICGAVDFELGRQIREETILPMVRALRHRGPDDEGLFCDGNVALGHRRLSIIDLEGGHQPIFNENKSVCVIVNGEIYNYKELRKALEGEHLFSTQSDSEVIVHLWEDFGEKCVDHLRGMFAFAVYDMNRKKVFLTRDRFGQKPLTYAITPHGFYFSSEIYPLTQVRHVDTGLCHSALDDYLSLHYIPAPDTMFRGIKKLLPAHTLTVSPDGIEIRRYWSIDPFKRNGDSYNVAAVKIHNLLEESVKYRMIADVSVGAFLSGGVDSSITVAFMRQIEPFGDVQSVCIGFDEHGYDERTFARQVADRFRTTHHEHLVKADIARIIPDLVRHYGEPYADSSAIPTWYLSEVTADHVKVALSGDGGDEIFAGYNRLDSTRLVEIYQKIPQLIRKRMISSAVKFLPNMSWGEGYISQLKQFLKGANEHPAGRFVLRNSVFSPEMKDSMYTDKLKEILVLYNPAQRFYCLHHNLGGLSEIEMLQHIDLDVFLPDDILTKIDIASMAHGLEVRSPFLDHKLAEYVLHLPFGYRYNLFRRKRILKRVGRPFFSSGFLQRRKKGFRLPLGKWFRTSLKKPLLNCLINSPIFVDSEYFEPGFTRQIFDEHQSGKVNHTDRLWSLWFLGEWSKLMNLDY